MANLHHGAKAIVNRSTQPADEQRKEKPAPVMANK